MSSDENRTAGNLMLLCIEHATVIDLLENVATYPVDLLREWKARQLEEFDAAVGGWTVSDEEAKEIIAVSVSMPVTFHADTINLGGGGGDAPGAAGGGGAAIGPGSIGGPGGSIGQINLEGEAGQSPGATAAVAVPSRQRQLLRRHVAILILRRATGGAPAPTDRVAARPPSVSGIR